MALLPVELEEAVVKLSRTFEPMKNDRAKPIRGWPSFVDVHQLLLVELQYNDEVGRAKSGLKRVTF